MRLLADTNITAPAVSALRAAGYDLVHSAERPSDPGDAALLQEATSERRIFVTKDHDIGTLVFRDQAKHAGVLLIDDMGDTAEEAALLLRALDELGAELRAGAFFRAGPRGFRRATPASA